MAREPSYPKDAPIGGKRAPSSPPSPSPAAESEGKDRPAASTRESRPDESRRGKHLMAGAAIGIGSAAIVAALLYANRSRRGDKA